MNKIVKTILILALTAGLGLAVGFANREVEILVYPPDGVTPAASIMVNSRDLSSGNIASNLLGGDFKKLADSLPWYIARASAITAYLLMFVIILWGAGMTMGFIYIITNPVEAWVIHKYLGIAFGVSILVHVFTLLLDRFINFKILDVLIPFYSSYKTLYLSLGIIGFYLLLAVILSSLLVRLKSPKFWRALHYAVYVLFVFSLIHGIYLGTDTKTSAMQAIYWITGVIFFLLMGYRIYWLYRNRV